MKRLLQGVPYRACAAGDAADCVLAFGLDPRLAMEGSIVAQCHVVLTHDSGEGPRSRPLGPCAGTASLLSRANSVSETELAWSDEYGEGQPEDLAQALN